MRKLLREHYQELLKEEIDYSSKIATVYHLTGFKTAQYDPVYKEKLTKTNKGLSDEVKSKRSDKKKTRAQSILSNIEYKAAAKDLKKFKTPQGQAYYIANNIRKAPYDLGSYYIPGGGKMYGKGLYTCYKLNPAIARTYGSVILRFDVDISSMLIFNAGIAKGIYGDNFKLEDQFLEICKKKNVDIRGFYNQKVSLDISDDSNDAIGQFLEFLSKMSNKPEFLDSTFDTDLRTAPMALQSILDYSRQFKNGKASILRDIIDGVIFHGQGDGPVCVIYHPGSLKNYQLTGAGYFDDEGNPVIESEIERLVGRSGTSLKDTFSFTQELDEEAREIDLQRGLSFKSTLANFSKEINDEDDFFFERFPDELNSMLDPLISSFDYACEDLITSRVESSQPGFDNYCSDISKAYKYVQFICSILAEPFLAFVDTFGPGLDIVSKDEFEKYCYILKQYAFSKNTPSLADFELKGLKCVAQNEEEFARLVEKELDPLIGKFYVMNDEGLADEFVYTISDDVICGGGTCVINNSISKFEIGDFSLNTKKDAQALKDSLASNSSTISDVEQNLIKLFSDERLRTQEGIGFLEQLFKYSSVINFGKEGLINGTLNFDEIANNLGYYSDSCGGGGDLFYTLSEQIGVMDFGASAYIIDRTKFDPEFILQRMYDVKDVNGVLRDAAGLSKQMFKEGIKAFNSANALSRDFVKGKVVEDKVGNLSWVVEDTFNLPARRDEILI